MGRFRGRNRNVFHARTILRYLRYFSDGKKIAIQIAAEKDDIWIYDTETWEGNKLTIEGSNGWPLWSLDGESVVFVSRSLEEEAWGLYSKKINEIGSPQMIWEPSKGVMATSWHPKEDMLAMNFQSDIWFIKNPLTDPKGYKFTGEKHLEWVGMFSPNGNWISYDVDHSGTYRQVVSIADQHQSNLSTKHKGKRQWNLVPKRGCIVFFYGRRDRREILLRQNLILNQAKIRSAKLRNVFT